MPPERGTYRGIYSSLPDDPSYQLLSPAARHTLLTMRVMRDVGIACIWRYYPEPIAHRTGYTVRQVERCLCELETAKDIMGQPARWIVREGPVIWIRNGLRWDPTIKLTNEKHREGVIRCLQGLPRLQIVLEFCNYYKLAKPFASPSRGLWLGIPSESESESYSESESDTKSEVEEGNDRTPKVSVANTIPPEDGLDSTLKAILDECHNLSLVSTGVSAGFWDQVLGACEPYPLADSRWLGAKIRAWDTWFAGNPSRRSRDRKRLESRLMGWLTRDLEHLARQR